VKAREVLIVLAVIFAAIVVLPLLGMRMWGFMMMGRAPGMMGGLGLAAWLFVIAGIALLITGLVRRDSRAEDPLDTLKRRVAAGEITKEQYEELRELLQRSERRT